MSDFSITKFVPSESELCVEKEKWNEYFKRIEDEYGVPRWETVVYVGEPDADMTTGRRLNPETIWEYVSGDAVRRFQESDDKFSVLIDITGETYKNLKNSHLHFINQDDYNEADYIRTHLASILIPRFRGDVDLETVYADEVEIPNDPVMDPSPYNITVGIERLCDNPDGTLARDEALFAIENCEDFFGNTFGNSSLMLRELLSAEIEPQSVQYCLEFEGDLGQASDWMIPIGI